MCNPEWKKGVELAVIKVNMLGFDGALGWGAMRLNDESDFLIRQGYDDYLSEYWERETGGEK